MVKIVDFRIHQKEDGTEFCTLKVQGGIEAVQSKETEKMYLTAKTANLPCTFSAEICKTLVGTDFPGAVKKVEVPPYEYTVSSTGEISTLTHRYEYLSDEQDVIESNVVKKELVL